MRSIHIRGKTETGELVLVKLFYVNPKDLIKKYDIIRRGGALGYLQKLYDEELSPKKKWGYNVPGITNHVHMEMYMIQKSEKMRLLKPSFAEPRGSLLD